ncbi:unnamed protein product, partial [marine sediment metagenome]
GGDYNKANYGDIGGESETLVAGKGGYSFNLPLGEGFLNDIATTFGQTKLGDGLYPKDDTQGLEFDTNRITIITGAETLTMGECGLVKLSAASPYTLGLPTAIGNTGRYYRTRRRKPFYH